MRVMRFACAVSLSAGLALSAGSAFAGGPSSDIFEGDWIIEDSKEPNTVECGVLMFSNTLQAFGEASGIGTGGEAVDIFAFADEPTNTSRDTKQGRVRQDRFAELNVRFDGISATGDIFPEKCKIDVKANSSKLKGHGEVSCKGDNLNSLLSADQVASIQTAFESSKRVKFKANANKQTWSLSITCDGEAFDED